jgi:HAD superfamily hydrolase (TIGR01509 family)
MSQIKKEKISNIIFDLNGVLFDVHKLRIARKVGIFNLLRYLISKQANPFSRIISILNTICKEEEGNKYPTMYYKGQQLPDFVSATMLGLMTREEKKNIYLKYIRVLTERGEIRKNYEKKIFMSIAEGLINIEKYCKPIKSVINVLKKLKENVHNKIFLLSNADQETFAKMQALYPDVFNMFDGMVVSAHVQMVKPEANIYHHLLNTYNLEPQTCVFIDDQPENIDTANELGINGIVYTKTPTVIEKLKRLGIL